MDTDKDRIEIIQTLVNQFFQGKEYSSIAEQIESIPADTKANIFTFSTLESFSNILTKSLLYQTIPFFFDTLPIPQKEDSIDCCFDNFITLKINEVTRKHRVKNKRFGIAYQFIFILINHLINKNDEIEEILEFADSLLIDTNILNKSILSFEDLNKVKISSNPIEIYFEQIFQGRYNPERILSQMSSLNDDRNRNKYISRIEREMIKANITYSYLKKILTKEVCTKLNKKMIELQQTSDFLREQSCIIDERMNDETAKGKKSNFTSEDSTINQIRKSLGWKTVPKKFKRQIILLKNADYIKITNNKIVIIYKAPYPFILALFEIWEREESVVFLTTDDGERKINRDKIISSIFYFEKEGKVCSFKPKTLGELRRRDSHINYISQIESIITPKASIPTTYPPQTD